MQFQIESLHSQSYFQVMNLDNLIVLLETHYFFQEIQVSQSNVFHP